MARSEVTEVSRYPEDFRQLGGLGQVIARTLGEGVVAQVVLVTDGIDWIRDHVVPEMPEGTQCILDFYHMMENVSKCRCRRTTGLNPVWSPEVDPHRPLEAEIPSRGENPTTRPLNDRAPAVSPWA